MQCSAAAHRSPSSRVLLLSPFKFSPFSLPSFLPRSAVSFCILLPSHFRRAVHLHMHVTHTRAPSAPLHGRHSTHRHTHSTNPLRPFVISIVAAYAAHMHADLQLAIDNPRAPSTSLSHAQYDRESQDVSRPARSGGFRRGRDRSANIIFGSTSSIARAARLNGSSHCMQCLQAS